MELFLGDKAYATVSMNNEVSEMACIKGAAMVSGLPLAKGSCHWGFNCLVGSLLQAVQPKIAFLINISNL